MREARRRVQALREARKRGRLGPTQNAALQEIERRFMQVAEPAAAVASAMVAEPVSGFVGMAALPWGLDAATNAINKTQDAMTYQPRTEGGREGMHALGGAMESALPYARYPLAGLGGLAELATGQGIDQASSTVNQSIDSGVSQTYGDRVLEETGSPALATAAYSMPVMGLEALGLKAGRAIPGRSLEMGDIGGQRFGQRGAVSTPTPQIPGTPEGRVMNTEAGGKLTFVETPEGRVQMYNPNRAEWKDVTDSPIAENIRIKDREILEAGGPEAFASKQSQIIEQRQKMTDQSRAEATAERFESDYRVQHQAPMTGDNPDVSDLNSVMPDIYSGKGLSYYGTGAAYDRKAMGVLQSMRGKPDADVTIYRAVPSSVNDFNAGDWVTTTREYAKDHIGKDKGWKIISKKVKAKELANDGNSIHEFGYDPGRTGGTMDSAAAAPPKAIAGKAEWDKGTYKSQVDKNIDIAWPVDDLEQGFPPSISASLTDNPTKGYVMGEMSAGGKSLKITESVVEDSGKGVGKKLYKSLIDFGEKNKIAVQSDGQLSPASQAVYNSLRREGFKVKELRQATINKDGWMEADGPIYEIGPKTAQ